MLVFDTTLLEPTKMMLQFRNKVFRMMNKHGIEKTEQSAHENL